MSITRFPRDCRRALAGAAALGAVFAAMPALAAPGDLTVAEVARIATPSIARVVMFGSGHDQKGHLMNYTNTGTAFLFTANGDFVTNCHVLTPPGGLKKFDTPAVKIQFADEAASWPATIRGCDALADIAVVHVDHLSPQRVPLRFAVPSDIVVGEDVVAIGFAMGMDGAPTVSRGIVSALHRSLDNKVADLIQTDASINHGNSGGPLLDLRGNVVGVNSYSYASSAKLAGDAEKSHVTVDVSHGLFYARSAATAAYYARRLVETGEINRADLGFRASTLDVNNVLRAGLIRRGIRIDEVTPGSPAQKAGLQVDDILYSIDDAAGHTHEVRDTATLNDVLALISAGDKVKLHTMRLSAAGWQAAQDGKSVPAGEVVWWAHTYTVPGKSSTTFRWLELPGASTKPKSVDQP